MDRQTQTSIIQRSETNPLTEAFKDKQSLYSQPKKKITELILKNSGEIAEKDLGGFEARHFQALQKFEMQNLEASHESDFAQKVTYEKIGLKKKIENLVNDWRTDSNFGYDKAEKTIKAILGQNAKDEDVLFMLKWFCIPDGKRPNFENNYLDLFKHI